MEDLRFNTAIAALIELNNDLVARDTVPRDVAAAMIPLLAPLAPHIAEELWSRLGHTSTVLATPWPEHDPRFLKRATVDVILQVSGKVRGKLTVAADLPEAELKALALADPTVVRHTEGKGVAKVIVVPGKLVNVVVTQEPT